MNKRVYIWLIIVVLGCSNPMETEVYNFGDELELKIGEKAIIQPGSTTVQFVDVLEDSRCPEGVTCVWSGNGKVKLLFEDEELFLNTHMDPQQIDKDEISIQLISLIPYPLYQHEIKKNEYKVRLLITEE